MARLLGEPSFRGYFGLETLVRGVAVASAVWAASAFGPQAAVAQGRTFGGYICRQECDVHAAGFKWAQARNIDDKRQCPFSISPSFHEGCMAFIQNPLRDPDEDDEGDPVGVAVAHPGRK